MSTHTLVIVMVSAIFVTVILAGVIAEYRAANRRQSAASEPPGSEK